MINMQRVFSATVILAILVLPLTVAKASADSNSETVSVRVEPKPEVVELTPVIITVEPGEVKVAPRARRVARVEPAREKVWTCSGWNDSAAGGGYRSCEWL